jgi:hypothetical protein
MPALKPAFVSVDRTGRLCVPMVATKQARTRHSVPWPMLAVAAFAAALYEAISTMPHRGRWR